MVPPADVRWQRPPAIDYQWRLLTIYDLRKIYDHPDDSVGSSRVEMHADGTNAEIDFGDARGRRRRRGSRTQQREERGWGKERGMWPCSLCERTAFVTVSGLRGHVATMHRQYCTWSGVVRPFRDAEREKRMLNMVFRGRSQYTDPAERRMTVTCGEQKTANT